MQFLHTVNQCLAAPGLAISSTSSALAKYANTWSFKANSVVSASITTANAPSLALATYVAPYPNGTASVVGALKADAGSTDTGILSVQVFALVVTYPETGASPTPVYTWLAGPAFSKYRRPQWGDFPKPDARNACAVGWVIVKNASAADFTPGTTALDFTGLTVTYIDNYAEVGS